MHAKAQMFAEIKEAIFYQKMEQNSAALADLVSDTLDSTYVQEDSTMNAAIEREMDLAGAVVEAAVEPIISINFAAGDPSKARFIAATPENLIQAGRALADLYDGRSTIEKVLLTKPRLGAVVKTPSESGFSLNTILNAGKSGNFSCFRVMKMGKQGEYVHPRFSSLMRKNANEGYDPRLTISKHVIIALILIGLEPVFVDVDGAKLDSDSCWQLIEVGMEWQHNWLNPSGE